MVIAAVSMMLFLCVVMELMQVSVRGGWLSDKKYLPLVRGLLKTGKNCDRIIFNLGAPFISKTSNSILTEYAIDGFGSIPRTSEMHSLIKNWVDSADAADKENIIEKFSIK